MQINTIHITTHDKNHKLAGIQSVSTSAAVNPICKYRSSGKCKDSDICVECYAKSLLKVRKNLGEHLVNNFNILNEGIIDSEILNHALFSGAYSRIESFGDVASVLQAENYIRIINRNPQSNFAIWTKNYSFWFRAFENLGKPENCTFVVSSPKVDVVFDINRIAEKNRKYIDHIFTAYNPENYPVGDKEGHCAGLRCVDCLKCYKHDTTMYINEALRTKKKANVEARKRLEEIINR